MEAEATMLICGDGGSAYLYTVNTVTTGIDVIPGFAACHTEQFEHERWG
jgi:hypothetical protein